MDILGSSGVINLIIWWNVNEEIRKQFNYSVKVINLIIWWNVNAVIELDEIHVMKLLI